MEFDELQQIWDSQNNRPLYVIDEKALHKRILSKAKQGLHITNVSELLLIIIHLGAGGFILSVNLFNHRVNISLYALAAWMFFTALYALVSRIRRIKGMRQFDRSMHGDLNYAISVATYQVRFSQITRWNILPVGVITLVSLWEGGKPLWTFVLILIIFGFGFYAGFWEHKFYNGRKRELEVLQKKLETKG